MTDTNKPKHPEITVELSGQDGNAFAVLGKIQRAMQKAHLHPDEITAFMDDATSGDYSHLLATAMQWVNVT